MKNLTKLFLVTAIFCITTACAKTVEDKIKDTIDGAACSLKSAIEMVGGDIAAVQDYLDHYHWKGLIEDEASSGVITLKHLQLNGHAKAVVVRPGERIEGVVVSNFNQEQCSSLSYYRVILGIHGLGPQTTICNSLGAFAGESLEKFTLIAPAEQGVYQIRFQPTETFFEHNALSAWSDPDATATIGVIVVQ